MAVDIKNLSDYSEKIRSVSHILTETLGTTTSYTFLEDTLRPYVKKNLKEYILDHWNDGEVVEIVKALKKQAELELKEGWIGGVEIPEGDDSEKTKEAVISYALGQMDGTSIESLSRLIVNDGYSKGQLKGHIFPDVLPAFKKWTEEGKKIYLYTSGMEMSKQCLSNCVEGDISELISGCFESSEFPGAKSESFRELCKKVDSPADKVAFLTHNAATACAAHKAGLVVIMLSRDGNTYLGNCTRESFPVISSFDDISKQICGKRKAPDADENTEGKRAKLDEASEKKADVEKPEEKDSVAVPEVKPVEGAVAVDGDMVPEAKPSSEEEEKMEVDEEAEEAKDTSKKTEVKIVVTAPADEVSVGKVSEEVNGAAEGEKETVKEVKDEVKEAVEVKGEAKESVKEEEVKEEVKDAKEEVKEDVKEVKEEVMEDVKDTVKEEAKETVEEGKEDAAEKDEQGEKSEASTGGAEKGEVVDSKSEEVKGKTAEDKVDEMKEGAKDDSVVDAKAETKAVSTDETPSTEEKSKENGVSEAKSVENGGSGDAASSEESSEKKVNENGVAHVNGDGVDAGGEGGKTSTVDGEAEVVAKKVEKDGVSVGVTPEAAEGSA